MNIYLIERHQGDHDDYRVTPVKAYENQSQAIVFANLCNMDIDIMLEKMFEYNKVYGIGLHAFQDKFINTIDMMSDEEYKDWNEKMNDEYNKILETFEHEDLEFADVPIKYEINKIEFIRKDS